MKYKQEWPSSRFPVSKQNVAVLLKVFTADYRSANQIQFSLGSVIGIDLEEKDTFHRTSMQFFSSLVE